MRIHAVLGLGMLLCAGAAVGCSSSTSNGKADGGASSGGAGAAADSAPSTATIYGRLGGRPGIAIIVQDFLTAVLADAKINGYFLNSTLDQKHLADCLTDEIASVTGGTEKYTCRTMKDAHAGLGISAQDFSDLVGHLSDTLTAAKVSSDDITTILGVLNPMAPYIVTDQTNDATIYQRIGRKPAIQTVITKFHARVAADAAINAFFAKTDTARLATCLVRQVCGATGGPCVYGKEIPDAEPGVKSPCQDMKTSHVGLGIATADFNELATDLVTELDAAGVTTADKNVIVGVLTPMCKDIVEKDPTACP